MRNDLGKLTALGRKIEAPKGYDPSVLDAFDNRNPGRDYWSWNVPNCEGYVLKAQVTKGGTFTLAVIDRFSNLDFLR